MFPQQNEELCKPERNYQTGIGAKIGETKKIPDVNKEIERLNENVKILCSNIENLQQRLKPIINESVGISEDDSEETKVPTTQLGNAIRKISDTVNNEILIVKNIISLLEI